MGLVTLQQLPVLALRLSRPQVGAWVATAEVDYQDSQETFEGLLELRDEAVTYKGTLQTGGTISGVARVDLIGGRGGLMTETRVQHFRDVTVRTLLDSLLRGVGETLDPTSTRAVVDKRVAFWTFAGERASVALSTLADHLEASWRVLPNGNVWFGVDAFPAAGEALLRTLLPLDRDDAAGNLLLAAETLELGPGVTVAGHRVGRVEHTFSRTESHRATFWTADAS